MALQAVMEALRIIWTLCSTYGTLWNRHGNYQLCRSTI